MTNRAYEELLESKSIENENACLRCGACCGAYDGDPCRFLIQHDDGKYSCSVYGSRLGWQKTLSGEDFKCVHIREIIHLDWPGSHLCAYKRLIESKR